MTRLGSRTRWRSCAGAMQAARSMAQLTSRCANDWNVLGGPAISLGACSCPSRKERDSMRSLVEPLVSNGYTLEMTPERLGWLEPTDAGLPVGQLREKYRQNGYLWLKGFFERDVILDFHRYFFETIISGKKTFFEIIASQEYEDFCTM